MVYLRKILVPTDLSQYSLAAMEYASSFGLLYASKLYLMYVVDADGKGSRHHGVTEGIKALEEFVAKNINPDIKLIPVVRTGSPAIEIKRFADEEAVDLVVMATHGWTGLRHIVLGSVAERVVRLSGVPVLTVKPQPIREIILQDEDVESDLHLR